MQSVIISVVIFVVISNCAAPVESALEDGIIEFLEEFRKRMCHPIPKWKLPALDPFQISHLEFKANNKYLREFYGSVTNFRIDYLSDFIIDEIKITPVLGSFKFIFNLTFPLITLNTLYTAKGSVANIISLDGDTAATGSVENLNILITGKFKLIPSVAINNLKIDISIKNLTVDLDKIVEDERVNDFVDALLNELGLELLDDVWQTENKLVEEIAQEKINNVLSNFTAKEIISIINGGGENPIFGPDDPPGDCKDDKKSRNKTEKSVIKSDIRRVFF